MLLCSVPPAWASDYKAAVAVGVITPTEPTWLGGYGSRTAPADGKIHDLHAKVLVIEDGGGYRVVLITLDTENVPRAFADEIATTLIRRHQLKREQIVVSCSHTHCGPALASADARIIYPMTPEQYAVTVRYTQQLRDQAIKLAGEALARLAPAELSWANGTCGFGVNRRNNVEADTGKPGFVPVGPVDHDVPVLRVESGGRLLAVLFGYACHCTTMAFQQWCGDWAGFAMLDIEHRHPGTTALFMTGCGADTNPLPRRKLELCEKYGKALGTSVETVLAGKLMPVRGPMRAALQHVDLAFESIPSRDVLEKTAATGPRETDKRWARFLLEQLDATGKLAGSHAYPVQIIGLGEDLLMVVLGGEVVVDYSLRLKRELGPQRTWVFAYANDLCAYMPSERVLQEGRYEGREAMIYYGQPSAWAAGLEAKIINAAIKLAQEARGDAATTATAPGR